MGPQFCLIIIIAILLVAQISASSAVFQQNHDTELIVPILIPQIDNTNFNQICFAIKLAGSMSVTIGNEDTVSKEFVDVVKNALTFSNCSMSFTNAFILPLTISEGLNDTNILNLEISIPLVDKTIILVEFTFNNKLGNYSINTGKLLNPGSIAQVLTPLIPIHATASLGTASYCGSYHLQNLGSHIQPNNTQIDVSFDKLKFEVIKGTVANVTDALFSNKMQDVCKNSTGTSQHGGGADNQFKSFSGAMIIIGLVLNYLNFIVRN